MMGVDTVVCQKEIFRMGDLESITITKQEVTIEILKNRCVCT